MFTKWPKKLKRGNLSFTPFCHHSWRGVIVPPAFLLLGSASSFSICVLLFLHKHLTNTFLLPHSKCTSQQTVICTVCAETTLRYNNLPSRSINVKMAAAAQWHSQPYLSGGAKWKTIAFSSQFFLFFPIFSLFFPIFPSFTLIFGNFFAVRGTLPPLTSNGYAIAAAEGFTPLKRFP